MKRTFAYREGKLVEITKAPEIRHSDDQRIIQEGSMSDRVLLGFKDQEQRHGNNFIRKLPFSPSHIRKVWAT